jgi:hypothetical protein
MGGKTAAQRFNWACTVSAFPLPPEDEVADDLRKPVIMPKAYHGPRRHEAEWNTLISLFRASKHRVGIGDPPPHSSLLEEAAGDWTRIE